MTQPDKLTVEDIKRRIVFYDARIGGYEIAQTYRLLLNTMREEQRLKEAIKTALDGIYGCYCGCADWRIAEKALKPYRDSEREEPHTENGTGAQEIRMAHTDDPWEPLRHNEENRTKTSDTL